MGFRGDPEHWIAGAGVGKSGKEVCQSDEEVGLPSVFANPIKYGPMVGAAASANPSLEQEPVDGPTVLYLVNLGVGDDQGDVIDLMGHGS